MDLKNKFLEQISIWAKNSKNEVENPELYPKVLVEELDKNKVRNLLIYIMHKTFQTEIVI